jgi:3-hydroxyisobutyrate dehydrogenase
MKLAIIGLGEVGRCYGEALALVSGLELKVCEQRISTAASTLADRLSITIEEEIGPWLQDADWVLSCVVGGKSLEVSHECLRHMKSGAAFADLTTAAPEQKRLAAAAAQAKQVAYVDVAIMGAIFLLGAKTPLLCSGDAATSFATLLAQVGADLRVLPDGRAGDAISLKILRSVFTKGMEALAVEVLMAADRQNLRPALYDVLKDVDQASLPTFLEMLVTTHVVHANRRMHEVEEAERQLAGIGIVSDVLDGVRQRFAHTSQMLHQTPLPSERPTLQQALDWLLEKDVTEIL